MSKETYYKGKQTYYRRKKGPIIEAKETKEKSDLQKRPKLPAT